MPAPAATPISIPGTVTCPGGSTVYWFTFTLVAPRLVNFVTGNHIYMAVFDSSGVPIAVRDVAVRVRLPAGTYYVATCWPMSPVAAPFVANWSGSGSSGPAVVTVTDYPGVVVSGAVHVRDDFLGSAGSLDLREPNVQAGVSGARWYGFIGSSSQDYVLGDGTLSLGVDGL